MTRSTAVVPTFRKVIHRKTMVVEYFPTPLNPIRLGPGLAWFWSGPDLAWFWSGPDPGRTGADQISLVPIQEGLMPI